MRLPVSHDVICRQQWDSEQAAACSYGNENSAGWKPHQNCIGQRLNNTAAAFSTSHAGASASERVA